MTTKTAPVAAPKKRINPAVVKAGKNLVWGTLGSVLKLAVEYGLTVGAAGLAGMAHPIPGVVQSGSAAFAVLASVRYFWTVEHGSAASVDDPATRSARAAQVAQSQQLLDWLEAELKKEAEKAGSSTAAGPYL